MFGILVRYLAYISVLLPGHDALPVERLGQIPYKEVDGRAQTLNLFVPAAAGPHPVVVLVHGGGWFIGSNLDYTDFATHFAISGFACARVNFRNFPPDGFTGQVDDIKDAIRWLRTNAAAYDLDPDAIGLFGSSSGGHLAGLAGLSGNGEGFSDDPPGTSSAVQALFLLYGLYDISPVSLITPVYRLYTGAWPWEAPGVYAQFSHVPHVDGSEPPTAIMHGQFDWAVPITRARAVVDALTEHGVQAYLLAYPGGHGFGKIRIWTRPDIWDAMHAFFHAHLKTAPQQP